MSCVAHIIPKDIQDWTEDEEERSSANIPRHSVDIYAASIALDSVLKLAGVGLPT